MILIESSWSGLPMAPNIIAPRQYGLTLMPVRPSVRIFIPRWCPGRRPRRSTAANTAATTPATTNDSNDAESHDGGANPIASRSAVHASDQPGAPPGLTSW